MRVMVLGFLEDQKIIDISTQDRLDDTALRILNDRFDLDYYPEPKEPAKPKMTLSAIRKIEDERIRDFGEAEWKRYREALKVYNQERERWQVIKDCVSKQDPVTALNILQQRSEHQNEEISIVEVRDSY